MVRGRCSTIVEDGDVSRENAEVTMIATTTPLSSTSPMGV